MLTIWDDGTYCTHCFTQVKLPAGMKTSQWLKLAYPVRGRFRFMSSFEKREVRVRKFQFPCDRWPFFPVRFMLIVRAVKICPNCVSKED